MGAQPSLLLTQEAINGTRSARLLETSPISALKASHTISDREDRTAGHLPSNRISRGAQLIDRTQATQQQGGGAFGLQRWESLRDQPSESGEDGRTRWRRTRWTWSTSLSIDTSGIHLQTQKCIQNTSGEQTGVPEQRKRIYGTMQNSLG